MALPLISSLSKTGRKALPLIEAGVSQGLPSRTISQMIKETFGKSIRRSTLLGVMRELGNIKTASETLKFMGKQSTPNPNRLPKALTTIRRKYSFVVKVQGYLTDTNESFTQRITIATDSLMTRAELEARAMAVIESSGEIYKMAVESALLERGVQAA